LTPTPVPREVGALAAEEAPTPLPSAAAGAAEPADPTPGVDASAGTPPSSPSPIDSSPAAAPSQSPSPTAVVTTPSVQPTLGVTPTVQPTLAGMPTAQPSLVVTPTPRPTPSGRVIDIAAPPPSGDVGRLFELSEGKPLRPGDQVVTNVIVLNSGTLDLTYAMSVDATRSSPLDTDPGGLQLSVSRCGATFRVCSETVYSGPAVVSNAPLRGPETVGAQRKLGLRPSTQDYLQLRVSFPASASNATANATSVLRFTWTSAQAF
jgi:hypothetical protein